MSVESNSNPSVKIIREDFLENINQLNEYLSNNLVKLDSILTVEERRGYNRLCEIRLHENIEIIFFDAEIYDKSSVGTLIQALTECSPSILIVMNYKIFNHDIYHFIPPQDTSRLFLRKELAINPTFGVMALKHRIATNQEIQQLEIDLHKLPKLLILDVQRRWYNFASGQVIAIERTNTYYRIVEKLPELSFNSLLQNN